MKGAIPSAGRLALVAAAAFLAVVATDARARPAATGTVKGRITNHGVPATDAVVSLTAAAGPAGASEPTAAGGAEQERESAAVIEQKDGRFVPVVLAVRVGTRVEFPNHDKVMHNVFSSSKAKRFDLGLFGPGESRGVVFDRPGVVHVRCNVHPNMEAFVVVVGMPFFAATDRRGRYWIEGLPLGSYRLEVWRPGAETRSLEVRIERPGEVVDLDLDLARSW